MGYMEQNGKPFRSIRGACYCRICSKVFINPAHFALEWNMLRSTMSLPVVKDPDELTDAQKQTCPNCLRFDQLREYFSGERAWAEA